MEPQKQTLNQPPPYTPCIDQPMPAGQPVVNIGTPTPILCPALGSKPTKFTCPSCRAQIVTNTQPETTTKTHLFALLLCAIGCWPCVWIPYFTDSCKTITHTCPNCSAYIGSQRQS